MKVKQLLCELNKYDPELQVAIFQDEGGNSFLPAARELTNSVVALLPLPAAKRQYGVMQ
jgi:hypothetical protein